MLPPSLFQALSVDFFVLESLLKRHRNSHGRTIYFRRMEMACKAFKKFQILDLNSDMESFERNFRTRQKQEKKKEQQWTMKVSSKDSDQLKFKQDFSQIMDKFVQKLPELVSRTEHASSALFTEINRGFFLPFCTVALASLARIRSLTLKLGRLGLANVKEMADSVDFLSIPQDVFDATMNIFIVDDSSELKESAIKKEQRDKILTSMGIAVPKVNEKVASLKTVAEDDKQEESINETKLPGADDALDIEEDERIKSSTSSHDDIGESMESLGFILEESHELQEKASKSAAQSPIDAIDQNTALLESFKHKQQRGGSEVLENKKKDKKRKESSSSAGQDQKERKKKKKKKVKKGDFFDNLFD